MNQENVCQELKQTLKSVEILLAATVYEPRWDFIRDATKRTMNVIEINLTIMIIKFV